MRGVRLCARGFQTAFVCFSAALSPVSYQLFHLVDGLLGYRSNGTLGAVGLSFLLASALGGVPELALQLFCSGEKAAPEELLWRGLNFFFCTF